MGFGLTLGNLSVRTGGQESHLGLQGLELSAPHPGLQGGQGAWRWRAPTANDLINHIYLTKPPKNSEGRSSESFQASEHMEIPGERMPGGVWKPRVLSPSVRCISGIGRPRLYPFITNQ